MTFFGTQPTFTQVPPKRCGFDHGRLGAVLGRALRAGQAAAAAADADQIEGLLGHCELHPERGENPNDILRAVVNSRIEVLR